MVVGTDRVTVASVYYACHCNLVFPGGEECEALEVVVEEEEADENMPRG